MKLEFKNKNFDLDIDLNRPLPENIRTLNKARSFLKQKAEELEKLWKLECEKNSNQIDLEQAIREAEDKTE